MLTISRIANLDVRVVVETDDGKLIYITYEGRADWSDGPGTKPIYMAPKFETSDDRYAWLNVQAVGKGRLGRGTVTLKSPKFADATSCQELALLTLVHALPHA